ncbi:MAG: hypothetical protein IKW99_01965 [Bacteroidales bacterium]|nr:hypothetical protein [Bacteroidales bacterium]
MKKIFTILFALAVFLFWMFVLPYHVLYQEEIQIFPYTWQHLKQCLAFPGGVASYLGEFFVQFFHIAWLGALLLAVLTALAQVQSWRVMNSVKADVNDAWYPLSFIPAVCFWAFLCDAGNLVSALVAFLLICEVALIVCKSKRDKLWPLAIALAYYLAGPMAFILVVVALADIFAASSAKRSAKVLDAVLTILTCVLVAGISISVFTQYPVKRLLCGVEYSHIPGQYTASFWTSVISLPVILLFTILLGGKPLKNKTRISVLVAVSAVIALASLVYVKNHCSKDMESIYAYDYHAANRQWDKIIAMAEKKTPRTPSEVICLNLALVMKGESGDRLFEFFQSGIPGLFPNYDTYVFLKFTGAEALYQAGLLNMALHYSFEAYQTFPGGRESARHIKRMAEVNMIKGTGDVAEKYLKVLSQTLFYRKWAKKYLQDQSLMLEDAEYSRLAGCRNSDTEIFDDMYDYPKQAILRSQVAKSGKADESYHYLLAYDLLAKDTESLANDIRLAKIEGPVPELYQEALLVPWISAGGNADYDKDLVSDKVLEKAQAFVNDLQIGRTVPYMRARYGKTFWFYYSSN